MLCLAGCSSSPKRSHSSPTAETSVLRSPAQETAQQFPADKQTLALSHWKAEGRIAAAKRKKGGNASFVWQQADEGYHIKLFGPFGSGAMFIIGNDKQVEVRQANGKISTAATPEKLLQKLAGLYVPITGLQHWMIGQPSPLTKPAVQKFDEQGRLLFLQQEGWQIHYEGYHSMTRGLPSKIHLKNKELDVKVIIKSWKK